MFYGGFEILHSSAKKSLKFVACIITVSYRSASSPQRSGFPASEPRNARSPYFLRRNDIMGFCWSLVIN